MGESHIHSERQTSRNMTEGEKRETIRDREETDRKNETWRQPGRKTDGEEGTGHTKEPWLHLPALTNLPAPGLLTHPLTPFRL